MASIIMSKRDSGSMTYGHEQMKAPAPTPGRVQAALAHRQRMRARRKKLASGEETVKTKINIGGSTRASRHTGKVSLPPINPFKDKL